MKITQDIRDYAKEHGLSEMDAVQEGLDSKAREFADKGKEIYIERPD